MLPEISSHFIVDLPQCCYGIISVTKAILTLFLFYFLKTYTTEDIYNREIRAEPHDVDRSCEWAQRILDDLGYFNVVLKVGDGTMGLKEEEPFDGIMVTAGSPDVPQPLVDQLAMGGRLVVPVGDRYTQSLIKIVRAKEGITKTDLGGCRFVNLLGTHGWKE